MRTLVLLTTLLLGFATQGQVAARKSAEKGQSGEEQALIVWIRLSDKKAGTSEERERLFKLEDEISSLIDTSGVGEYDGNEIGKGFFTLYIYGPSASRLWEVTSAPLKRFRVPVGSYAIKRYGKPGAKEERMDLPK